MISSLFIVSDIFFVCSSVISSQFARRWYCLCLIVSDISLFDRQWYPLRLFVNNDDFTVCSSLIKNNLFLCFFISDIFSVRSSVISSVFVHQWYLLCSLISVIFCVCSSVIFSVCSSVILSLLLRLWYLLCLPVSDIFSVRSSMIFSLFARQ